MSNLTCSRSCLMKRDLECSVDKLSFMKENWPSFAQKRTPLVICNSCIGLPVFIRPKKNGYHD